MSVPERIACLWLGEIAPEKSVQALAESCQRFTPMIALRQGEAIFLEIGKSRHLFSEESVTQRLLALAKRFGFQNAEVAIEDNAALAFAVVRHFGKSGMRWQMLPLSALLELAAPFESDPDEQKIIRRLISLLTALGIRNIGEFCALPTQTLASRFGKEAVELSSRLQGRVPLSWPGFHPEPQIIEKIEQTAENLEGLVFVLRGLVDRAMARLRGRAQRASVIQVGFELERWSSSSRKREWKVEFSLPQGSSVGILPILQEQLSFQLQREPLDAPVETVWFEILETVPGRGAQRDFFSQKEEQEEALESLFARLSQKLGENQAYVARPVDRYLPEKAYERSNEFFSARIPSTAATPARPSRLLKAPEPVLIRGRKLSKAGKVWPEKIWEITQWEGPERISGEWWKEGFDRDYYRIVTQEGERLWIFLKRDSEAPTFFLHGYFD